MERDKRYDGFPEFTIREETDTLPKSRDKRRSHSG